MRKITSQAAKAFHNNHPFSLSNTTVTHENDETKMYLHGNLIALKDARGLFVTNAGWQSNTTKERLNGLSGVSIYQKKGQWFLNDAPWNGELIKI